MRGRYLFGNFLHTKQVDFFLIIWFDACLVCLALTDPIITTWPWAVWGNVRLCIQPCCLLCPQPHLPSHSHPETESGSSYQWLP